MPKAPDVPKGLNVAEFGFKVMRWGTGDAAARERRDALTRNELVDLEVTVDNTPVTFSGQFLSFLSVKFAFRH